MASRRRPPPRSETPAIESPSDASERTVLSEMPVFEDEAPTPVPEVVVAPRPPPRRASLGASPPPEPFPEPDAPHTQASAPPGVPREATFVGLPVGLGLAPAPEPPASRPRPAPESSSPEVPARRGVSVGPAAGTPAGPKITVRAPSATPRRSASPPPSVSPVRVASPPALRLPVPGAPPAKPAGREAPPAVSVSAGPSSAPAAEPPAKRTVSASPRPSLPLGFEPEALEPRKVEVPVLTPDSPRGLGTGLAVAAGLCVLVVAGLFVGGGDPTSPEADSVRKGSARAPVAAVSSSPRPAHPPEAPTQPSSAVTRAKRSKRPGASIARRQHRPPVWPSARVAALAAPGAKVPAMGGEPQTREDYGRPYLQQAKDAPAQPMLYLFTMPPGMLIEVEGKLYGRTPLVRPLYGEVKNLDVRLSGPGYRTRSEHLRPEKDGSIRFNGVMTPDQQP